MTLKLCARGKDDIFVGFVIQEDNDYKMYILRGGLEPELFPLMLREVIFVLI